MSKNNNKANQTIPTVQTEQKGNEAALATAIQAAPAVQAQTVLIRSEAEVAKLFVVDGDSMRLRSDLSDADKPNADEIATLVQSKLSLAQSATTQATWALHEANGLGTLVFDCVCARLMLNGVNSTTLSNMKHVATRVIPLAIKHGYKGGVSLLKDQVAAMHDSKGETLTTPLSIALQKAFLDGVNPAGTVVVVDGMPKDVSGKPITTVSLRAIRAGYDKDGQPKQAALPPASDTTTEQRSASASNATGTPATAQSEEAAKAAGAALNGGKAPLVDESKPQSAGAVPATAGVKANPGKPLTESEQITAGFSGLALRFVEQAKTHTWSKAERDEILAALKKVAEHFGAQLLGV